MVWGIQTGGGHRTSYRLSHIPRATAMSGVSVIRNPGECSDIRAEQWAPAPPLSNERNRQKTELVSRQEWGTANQQIQRFN